MKTKPKKLILFDIDGTLLLSGPLWKKAFLKSVQCFFPSATFPSIPFAGKTDVQVCKELLDNLDLSESKKIDAMGLIFKEYIQLSQTDAYPFREQMTVLPGVPELLGALSNDKTVLFGLLTGNLKQCAELKLKAVQLDHYFDWGVFGDNHWDRYQLPQLAVDDVKKRLGYHFTGKEIVIIGDTVHDINCGKSLGVKTIAVGTGRGISKTDLLSQNPDFFFEDLSSTSAVLNAIFND